METFVNESYVYIIFQCFSLLLYSFPGTHSGSISKMAVVGCCVQRKLTPTRVGSVFRLMKEDRVQRLDADYL